MQPKCLVVVSPSSRLRPLGQDSAPNQSLCLRKNPPYPNLGRCESLLHE